MLPAAPLPCVLSQITSVEVAQAGAAAAEAWREAAAGELESASSSGQRRGGGSGRGGQAAKWRGRVEHGEPPSDFGGPRLRRPSTSTIQSEPGAVIRSRLPVRLRSS